MIFSEFFYYLNLITLGLKSTFTIDTKYIFTDKKNAGYLLVMKYFFTLWIPKDFHPPLVVGTLQNARMKRHKKARKYMNTQ